MFAFAIWDKKSSFNWNRDRMGRATLFGQCSGENKVFIFGFVFKALKVHPEFTGEINRDAVVFKCVITVFQILTQLKKDIYKLLPGHYLQ